MCISERLRQVCEAKNWKITDFAEQTGIAYRTMQGYIGNSIRNKKCPYKPTSLQA